MMSAQPVGSDAASSGVTTAATLATPAAAASIPATAAVHESSTPRDSISPAAPTSKRGLDPSFDASAAVAAAARPQVEIHCEADPTDHRKTVVVIGLSMVGWRVCEALVEHDTEKQYRELHAHHPSAQSPRNWLLTSHCVCPLAAGIVSFCEESRLAYNRVGLGQMFDHGDPDKLLMADEDWYRESGITVASTYGIPTTTRCPGMLKEKRDCARLHRIDRKTKILIEKPWFYVAAHRPHGDQH